MDSKKLRKSESTLHEFRKEKERNLYNFSHSEEDHKKEIHGFGNGVFNKFRIML
jgi:hypothetical protein